MTPLGVSRQPSAETPTNGQVVQAPPIVHQNTIQRARLERGLSMMEGRGRFAPDDATDEAQQDVAPIDEQDDDAILDLNFQEDIRQRANSGYVFMMLTKLMY